MKRFFQPNIVWIVEQILADGVNNVVKVFDTYENAQKWVISQTRDIKEAWKYRIFEYPVESA